MNPSFSKQRVIGEWFKASADSSQLPREVVERLDDDGYVVIPGPIASDDLMQLAQAYDQVVISADPYKVRLFVEMRPREVT